MPITVTCLYCSKVFTTSPSRTRQFCSNACYRTYQHEHHTMQITWIICGKTFENCTSRGKEQGTCRSEECIRAFLARGESRHNYEQRKYTLTCCHCEKPFTPSEKHRKYCSTTGIHD